VDLTIELVAKETRGKGVHFERRIAERDFVVLYCHQGWPAIEGYASCIVKTGSE